MSSVKVNGAALAQALRIRGLSVAQAAEASGLSEATLRRMLRGGYVRGESLLAVYEALAPMPKSPIADLIDPAELAS